jgi:hypothetical protein
MERNWDAFENRNIDDLAGSGLQRIRQRMPGT